MEPVVRGHGASTSTLYHSTSTALGRSHHPIQGNTLRPAPHRQSDSPTDTQLRPYVDYAVDTAPLRRRLRLAPETKPEPVTGPERLPWDWSSPAANTKTNDEFAEFEPSEPFEDPDQVDPDQGEKQMSRQALKELLAERREAIRPGALSANVLPQPVKGRSGRELIESEKELLKWQARREWFARERYVLAREGAEKNKLETEAALAGETDDVAEAQEAGETEGATETKEAGETKAEETERTSTST